MKSSSEPMSTGYSRDAAELPSASVEFDWDQIYADEQEKDPMEYLEAEIERRCAERVQAAVIRFLAQIVDSSNYRLKTDVAIMASGFPFYQGMSFTEMGKKHSISKQAFSKHVLRFQDELGLPPTRGQKSTQARETYRRIKRRSNNQEQCRHQKPSPRSPSEAPS
jgi:hypothetical protein